MVTTGTVSAPPSRPGCGDENQPGLGANRANALTTLVAIATV
jgi:hypothetical protein